MNILLQSYNKFTKLAKKPQKNALFFKNIWLCQKKAVPLHPLLKMSTSS